MKKALFTVIAIIFITSAVLLVYSLPQCGHGGFQLGPAMSSTGSSHCGGNIYDRHITFLQTVFLARLEWLLLIILVILLVLTLFVFRQFLFKIQSFYPKEKLKKYFYRLSKPFDCLALANCQGRIYQRLLE